MVASVYKEMESDHPSYIHNLIANLPFHLILTTAHDNLLSNAMRTAGKQPINKSFRFRGTGGLAAESGNSYLPDTEFGSTINPMQPNIYHLFGSAEDPNEMVVSEEDVTDFFLALIREKNKRIPPGLASTMQGKSHRYLFLGFGIRQLHLRVLIKLFIKALVDNPKGNPNLVTESLKDLEEAEVAQTVSFFRRGTKIDIENGCLVTFLEELKSRFDKEGGYKFQPEISQSAKRAPQIKVFISYVHEDAQMGLRLYKGLEGAGLNPWMDQFSLEGGRRWDPELEEQIESSDFVVVVMSTNLAQKTDSYVNKEIELAIERSRRVRSSVGAFLIPLATSDLAAGDKVPELDPFHRLPLRDDHFEEDLARLVSDLKKNQQRRARG
jgi:hypothetical protein